MREATSSILVTGSARDPGSESIAVPEHILARRPAHNTTNLHSTNHASGLFMKILFAPIHIGWQAVTRVPISQLQGDTQVRKVFLPCGATSPSLHFGHIFCHRHRHSHFGSRLKAQGLLGLSSSCACDPEDQGAPAVRTSRADRVRSRGRSSSLRNLRRGRRVEEAPRASSEGRRMESKDKWTWKVKFEEVQGRT